MILVMGSREIAERYVEEGIIDGFRAIPAGRPDDDGREAGDMEEIERQYLEAQAAIDRDRAELVRVRGDGKIGWPVAACPDCDHMLQPGWGFCPMCGRRLKWQE